MYRRPEVSGVNFDALGAMELWNFDNFSGALIKQEP